MNFNLKNVYQETLNEYNRTPLATKDGWYRDYSEYNLKQIEKYFVKYINPIIKNVQTLFQQYGYYYEVIGSLKDKNITVKNINCKYLFKYKKSHLIKFYILLPFLFLLSFIRFS